MTRSLLLLAVVLPFAAHSQTSELAFNLGFSTNSKMDYSNPLLATYNSRGGKSPFISFKYLRNYHHWQYGIGADFVSPSNSYKDVSTGDTKKVFTAFPLMPVYLVGNRTFSLGRHDVLYAGAALGAGITLGTTSGEYSIPNSSVMPLIGVQAGYTHYFGRFGLNLELGEKYLPALSSNAKAYNITSGTIGFRWKLK